MRRRRPNMALEMAAMIPLLLLLIVGMVQFGKLTFQYYALKKMVYAAGRQVAVQQGINFCDVVNDPTAAGGDPRRAERRHRRAGRSPTDDGEHHAGMCAMQRARWRRARAVPTRIRSPVICW